MASDESTISFFVTFSASWNIIYYMTELLADKLNRINSSTHSTYKDEAVREIVLGVCEKFKKKAPVFNLISWCTSERFV